MGYTCISLDMVEMGDNLFKQFLASREARRPLGKEADNLLAEYLGFPEDKIRQELHRHPFARDVSAVSIKKVLMFLFTRGFTALQIYNGLQVVLYRLEVVRAHLEDLPRMEGVERFQEDWVRHPHVVQLLLYSLEREYHFTGEGLWQGGAARGAAVRTAS